MNKQKKKSAATTVAAARSASSPLPPVGGADALPSVGAPTPPAADNPVAVSTRKGLHALAAQMDVAENAAKELRTSTLFSQILGPKLGTAKQFADAIDFAAQWYAQAQSGATWASYTQKESDLSWNYVQAMIDRMRVGYQAAVAADPAIANELPNFTKLLSVRQAVAAKGVETKRRIKSGEIVVNKSAKPPRKGTKASPKATPATAPVPVPTETAPAPAAAPLAPVVTPITSGANGVNGASH
jgi:hypothetical protein